MAAPATVREMLDAGMHYGHHASRWNPKMAPYIYGKRNTIHIIDLRQTMRGLVTACRFLTHVVSGGRLVVFVGAKRQAKRAVRDEAMRCGMPSVTERWLGGMLTNFRTVRSRLERLLELEDIIEGPAIEQYSKKDASRMRRELLKIRRNLDGVRNMDQIPGVVVVIDPRREKNAVAEARRLNLPTVGLADTDCDPDALDVLIPGNDDAMRSIALTMRCMADAVLEGKEKRIERERIAAEEAAKKSAEAAKKKAEAEAEAARKRAEAAAQAAKAKAEAEAQAAKAKAEAEAVARGAEAHRARKAAETTKESAVAAPEEAPAAQPSE